MDYYGWATNFYSVERSHYYVRFFCDCLRRNDDLGGSWNCPGCTDCGRRDRDGCWNGGVVESTAGVPDAVFRVVPDHHDLFRIRLANRPKSQWRYN